MRIWLVENDSVRSPISFPPGSEDTDRADCPSNKSEDEPNGFPDYWNRSFGSGFEVTDRKKEPNHAGNPEDQRDPSYYPKYSVRGASGLGPVLPRQPVPQQKRDNDQYG
jgi:hypothetical protein